MVRPVKRKASATSGKGASTKKAYKAQRTIAPSQKGFLRTGGFYGRYSGTKPELKFHDIAIDVTPIAVPGAVVASANVIAQGVGESERIGRKMTIVTVLLRWRVTLLASVASNLTDGVFRMIIFVDKQCNGATAAVTDILAAANYQSFNNLANKGRFRTLHDRTHVVNAMAVAATDNTTFVSMEVAKDGEVFLTGLNIPVEYSASTPSIADIRSNNVGLLLIAGAGVLNFDSQMRVRFSDGS